MILSTKAEHTQILQQISSIFNSIFNVQNIIYEDIQKPEKALKEYTDLFQQTTKYSKDKHILKTGISSSILLAPI